ncbi:MAG: prefoldin subunit alpha [Nanoarchaeota archaeon]|nr:prefoldin subunit alpha [Nanoarchaeota archaeon]
MNEEENLRTPKRGRSEEAKQQELMFKFSLFEQHIRQLQQQIQAVEQAIVDMNSLNLGLDELVGKKDKEVFAPIGRGILAKTKLISEELLVDVGGKNFVKKSIPETKEMISNQIQKLEYAKRELEQNLEQVGKELEKVMNER